MYTKVSISAHVSAPVEKAWECYTDPKHIVNWNFAAPEWHCPSASNDMRVGGIYSARMEARDGSFGFDFAGEYTAVDMGKSYTMILGDGRSVDLRFEAADGGTKVFVDFDAEDQNPIEFQKGGWQAILNNYANYASNL